MVKKHSLQELWIPEDKDLEEEYQHLPRCNIFMSNEFTQGYQGPISDKALVLI